jgi:hypothetical protein
VLLPKAHYRDTSKASVVLHCKDDLLSSLMRLLQTSSRQGQHMLNKSKRAPLQLQERPGSVYPLKHTPLYF